MYRVGLSSCGKEFSEKLFADYREAGIEAMEVSVGKTTGVDLPYREIAKWAKDQSVELWSYHLPFGPFSEIDISNPELQAHTVAYFADLMGRISEIGIDKFIIHPSGEPIRNEDRPLRMACAKESLFQLAEAGKKYGVILAVEDLPRTCLGRNSEEILELISVHPDLAVCFDTNHLLSEDPAEFVRRVGDRIITTHVSDYDFIDERHWLPGEGSINWQALLQALCDVHYRGVWLYELGFGCPKTLLRERDLTCRDFAQNAEELFAGHCLTVYSTPKPNLDL